ncbi:Stk1 family PASTA domain-containing Ser/Thr kinase [Luteimicrobium sp. NPDC057192]|uniref:Stk1 family PASTA domain-containing Ser/Thr kinase n=1 Tax=Luteimicrobium sp. NPDC057192 TaxID=3346042 RepID=UPI00363E4693
MVENPQRILGGRYQVGELIGRGGMAEVHIGHDARLGRTVAIKILRADLARDPSFLARFRREAQAAAALNHPAIVAVYDTGEDIQTDQASGQTAHTPFIVMEYVEGHTVRDILRDGHAVPIDEAIEITSGVLSALEYSHHAGIVHRDIKPANVMITPTGAVKVMDFGIARAMADSAATMTQTQAVVGTAQYLSPEQALGQTVDARSDLYSTGCLLFELLTGRPPFQGDSPVAVAYQHVGEVPPKPSDVAPDVPEVLDRITLKALMKDRNQRYGSAAEFRSDLDAAMRGGAVSAPGLGALGAGAVAGAAAGAAFADPNPTVAFDGATQVLTPTAAGWGAATPAAVPPPTQTSMFPDDAGPGDEEPEKKSNKALIWTLVTIGVIAIAAIITMLLLNGNKTPPVKQVTVPSVIGLTEDKAQQKLADANLKMEKLVDDESDKPTGQATRQDPGADASATEDTSVKVYFSAGPKTDSVPNVKGLSQADAREKLKEAGFTVADEVRSENSKDVPQDAVTRTDPKAGSVRDKGTEIMLYVSNGLVTLDDLVGKTRDEALDALDKAGLQSDTEEQETPDASQVGRVLSQAPAAGSVKQGTRIKLTIGKEEDTTVTIPSDLVGKTQEEAEDALGGLSLNVDPNGPNLVADDTVPAGIVMDSNPKQGTQVKVGDTVVLTVSSGPATPGDGQSTDPGVGNGNGDGNGDGTGGGDGSTQGLGRGDDYADQIKSFLGL